MAGILIYSSNTALALELLTAAKVIGYETKALCIADEVQAHLLDEMGAEVYQINNSIYLSDTSNVAELIVKAAEKLAANIIMLSSDRKGKELAGRVAQKCNAGCLTDVKAINVNGSDIECERNALGGATIVTQLIKTSQQVIAISPKTFKPVEKGNAGCINMLEVEVGNSRVRLIERIEKEKDSVDIQSAEVLLAVGCGAEESDISIIESIAGSLGGLVGCSKPVATDRKWFPEDRIIGLSGNICKPDLGIVLGVSGQVQFTVGIRDARILVSINNDENAVINQTADYFMVADLKDVLPELKQML